MTLLEAITLLIETAKTYAPDEDRKIAAAVKRMEKRRHVLLVRAAWTRKRNRIKAFYDAMGEFGGGVLKGSNGHFSHSIVGCRGCKFHLTFRDFCKGADWTGHGRVITLTCPKCGLIMERSKLRKKL